MVNESAERPRLNVIIVGAGLCGLTCGAALRESANVTILESAPALGEIGAAVHLAPNAHRILKALGAELMKKGAMPCKNVHEWNAKDNRLVIDASFDPLEEAGCEWALCHRVDLQQELMRLATTPDGPGTPCQVLLGSPVIACDPSTATVTTQSGKTYQADVVIGADGLKSVIRAQVVGDKFRSQPSGHSAYRALVPAHKVESVSKLAAIGLLDNRITVVNGGDRRIIAYPTRDKTLLNLVCPLPDSELAEISEEKWSARGNPLALVKSYSTFDPMWQDLLSQIEECGLWQLRDQEPLDQWVNGRTIIIGDAAHSMLPHQGQGASQAIEDAEAVQAYLSNAAADDVHEALEKIYKVRIKRATYIQQISRGSGLGNMRKVYRAKLGQVEEDDAPLNPGQYRDFSWNYFGALDWEKTHPEWVM
ncbi:uncharacterized protein I303_106932 [Kwoniella dejecticola CBS 10117]|uniref:FAD-binding domain-containing protein n=1 Tax=Kwoniella dejecticola CBS 10117 TaxID=1296121 RepID=A0A1A5ZTA4_9TREE|nr:uncharacterized protein I303_08429 [Kwoniella dejecticola CBS 10117]OBR81047.1 hypothetical protein I303_08429 [Kwoniella dejecticola CBS 10117]